MLEIVIGYNAKNRLLFHAPAKENTIIRIKNNCAYKMFLM